ncbi:Putative carbamoyl transferase, NodU family protein [Minicystis rosea]|nr:Putative carbamoyl transferase, NodU family protein [Minicystis rosea]
MIVGHANGIHDPAIAFALGDAIYAEALERHLQIKRALCSFGLFYSSRALHRAFRDLEIDTRRLDEIALRTCWSYTAEEIADLSAAITGHRDGVDGWMAPAAAAAAMDATFEIQLPWILAGRRPGFHRPREIAPRTGRLDDVFKPAMRLPGAPRVRSAAVPHHLAHAANAVYTSPFEECVVMIVDGAGERESTSFFHFHDDRFEPLSASPNEQSLGLLYALVTHLCGFDVWEGEEWKVMGLAAYGKPVPEIQRFFHARTRLDGLRVALDFAPSWPEELEAVTGPLRVPGDRDVLRAADLAFNFQEYFAEIIGRLATAAARLGLSKNLAFAGGCALNSAANGRIVRASGFERLHVPSAPADDGNALGCVLYEKHAVRREPRLPGPLSPYLGSDLDLDDLERALSFRGLKSRKLTDPDELCAEVAALLARGDIIGWMQGRAEFGPRALGHRSILADPRAPDMKDRINARVKFREEYRPLAPAILHEHGPAYFDPYERSPYMERALPFRPEVRDRVPAVVHVDGTGRLQSVERARSPLFHRLISAFHARTGVPLLVNTSLNVMGKPIVHSTADALTVFVSTGLDHLVMGPHVLSKDT